MPSTLPFDEGLSLRLPLPLAQLYRRAHNAKSVQERHHAAFYLWEASLKLLGATAVGFYLASGKAPDAALAERLQNLARPSVGHWWEIVRSLTVELADSNLSNVGLAKVRELLLGRMRDDLPRVAGLDAALLTTLEGAAGSRTTVRLTELFDRLVRYRNREFGHGAMDQRPTAFYEEMGQALLAGVPQLLDRLDVLAGTSLIFIADVRRLPSGTWLIERYELTGDAPRRLESLELAQNCQPPLPERVHLSADAVKPAAESASQRDLDTISLHPLVAYHYDANEFLFLNARRGKQRVEYLGYTTGRIFDRVEPGAQSALLADLLNMPVDDGQLQAWQAKSQSEESPSRERERAEFEEPSPSRRLGEFELLSELGRGGMGVVYRAWQPSLGRQVALKCLLRSGDSKAEARFAREIAALGRVEHPNVVRIFTSGAEGDRWFYAMELVEGATLAAVCERLQVSGSKADALDLPTWQQVVSTVCEETRKAEKPLTQEAEGENGRRGEGERAIGKRGADASPIVPFSPSPILRSYHHSYVRHVAALIRQAADAAHALHEQGIIHRDIKPGNILVDPAGTTATLMDLGLAQIADDEQGRLTRTRQFVGTLRYASPEQVLAVAKLKPQSDVYSLGATLWELLALRPLFGATDQTPTPELMQKIQYEEPARLRKCNPAVPRNLAAVVEKCLRKDPRQRYTTANELARDLARFLAGQPVRAREVSRAERAWMWVKRNPVVTGLLLALAVAVIGGLAAFFVKFLETREALADARKAEKKADDEARKADDRAWAEAEAKQLAQGEGERAEKHLARAELLIYGGKLSLAQRAFQEGNGVLALQYLDECQWNLRGWEHRHLWTRFNSKQTFLGQTDLVTSVAWSPDGKRLVTGSARTVPNSPAEANVWDTDKGHKLLSLKGHTNGVTSVAWSPDGKRLLTGSWDMTAKVWDADKSQELLCLKGHTNSVDSVAWSPDGKRLATGSGDKTVKVWDAEAGQELLSLKGHTWAVRSVAWSPDGKRLATGSYDTTAKVWDADKGQELLSLKGHSIVVWSVAWSPDGKRLATGSWDNTVKVWDADKGEELLALKGHTDRVTSAAWSPDGKRLATGSFDKTAKVWDADKGEELLSLTGHTEHLTSVAWSPDGKRLATGSGDNTATVWDADKGWEIPALKGHTDMVSSVAWSPDSKRIATGSDDKTTKVWNADNGQDLLALKGHTDRVSSVAWSPDGKRLATGSWDNTVKVWDADNGQELLSLKGHTGMVTSVAWSPDGKRVVTGSGDGTAKVWDAEAGQELYALKGRTQEVVHVAWSPDGKRLATAGSLDKITIWNADNGQELLSLESHKGGNSIAWSPDGKRLLTAIRGKAAKVWDADKGQELQSLSGHTEHLTSVAWSPDGKRLITGSLDKTAKVWDADKGQELLSLKGHTHGVTSVAWSPDGKRLATGSEDKTAKVWDAGKGENSSFLTGHTDLVSSVAWSPDGKRLLSGSADRHDPSQPGEVKVWHADKGQEILSLKGQTSGVKSVAWSADGKRVYAWDAQDKVFAWSAADGKPVEPVNPPTPADPGPARSPDGFRLAKPDGSSIAVTDSRIPRNSNAWPLPGAAERKCYHSEQAVLAENDNQWFAAAFHLGRLLLDDPDNADLKCRRDAALKKHASPSP